MIISQPINFSLLISGSVKYFDPSGKEHIFEQASTFDEIAKNLQPGWVINGDIEVNDKGFADMKKITVIGKEGQTENPAIKPQPDAPKATQSRDDIIMAQVAFKGVIDLMCANVINVEHPMAKLANKFINEHLKV